MARINDLLEVALKRVGDKPADSAGADIKKAYSESISAAAALAVAQELRHRGMKEARPATPGEIDGSGAERRMAGGIGAKKVDVTWSTETSGLVLALSIKTINFADRKTRNFQKNLTNRRGDMLFEAVTLHRRFPYAVLGGIFFLDAGAAHDATAKRRSTFINAHARMRLFTGRNDPAGRDEQYERLYIALMEASSQAASLHVFEAGKPDQELSLEAVMDDLVGLVAERNPDFYEAVEGRIRSAGS